MPYATPFQLLTVDGLALEALRDDPPGPARGGVVLCHPHPQMGGSMHAPFIEVAAARMAAAGYVVIRFNTRGTGRSEGRFGGGVEEAADLDAAWGTLDVEPHLLAGWSFGARLVMAHVSRSAAPAALFAPVLREGEGLPPLAKPAGPVCAVVGDRDRFVDPAEVEAFLGVKPVVLDGCDHFFIGRFGEQAADAAISFFDSQSGVRS